MATETLRQEDNTITFDHVHMAFEKCQRILKRNHNLYMKGDAGSGKTTLAKQLADSFNLDFAMIGRVDDIFALTGYRAANGEYIETDFFKTFTQGGVFLADEMDRWAPEAVTGINAALANGFMAFPHGQFDMHEDFLAIAAGNTMGNGHDRVYTAAQALDGSTMNRFVKVAIDYDETMERAIALAKNADAGDWVDFVQACRKRANQGRLDYIISPRDSIVGADLLAEGFAAHEVREMTFFAGVPDRDRLIMTGGH